MLRTSAVALVALFLLGVGLAVAADATEVKGKIKSVDADKSVVVVTVDGKDMEFKITDDTKLINAMGNEIKMRLKAKAFKEGADVVVTCEKKDGKEVCTKVQIAPKQ
jgi:Cu/Ag efflux protein CusF